MSYSIKRDPILDTKYIFLRFLQAYYSTDLMYKWDPNPITSKILILDKHAFDIGKVLTRPAIILNRNNLAWSYASGNQNAINTTGDIFSNLAGDAPNVTPDNKSVYSDLLVGGFSFIILSKNGIEAERISSTLFTLFTAYKNDLRNSGIHKITNLNIGPEQVVKQTSEHELISVSIDLTMYRQIVVKRDETYHELLIYINGELMNQGFDYTIELNGKEIIFKRPIPINSIITCSYINAATLDTINNVNLIATNDPLKFLIPDNNTVLGHYVVFENENIEVTNV